jgi:predicted small lipoprotein YifL
MTCRRTRHIAAIATLAVVAGGCGKKGPPLPPFVRIPAAVETIDATRFGDDVYVTLTVPAENVDTSLPANVARVDVYGYTGAAAPPLTRWAEFGTLVSSIPVTAPPPTPEGTAPPPVSGPGSPASSAVFPGSVITIIDRLDGDELKQGPVPAVQPLRPEVVSPAPSRPSGPLRRFYVAIPFNERGQFGPPGKRVDMVLTPLPEPPAGLQVTYDPTAIVLSWEPSGGLLGFLFDRPLPPEVPPFDFVEPSSSVAPPDAEAAAPEGPTTYHVYRETSRPMASSEPSPTWRTTRPVAINDTPLAGTTLRDAIEFGVEHCYTVRAQRGGVLSTPSSRVCVTPSDTFPPSVPTGLAAVPSDGAINLIWEPNSDSDLGGYLVLRRGPGDATLRQLTSTPLTDARYRDAAVESGAQYSYAVVAVDRQTPRPNASAPSATVDEVAR